jgi:hypothetical protein
VARASSTLHSHAEPPPDLAEGFRLAVIDLARVSKQAIDAGVDKKLALIAEGMAEQISLAAEEALAAVQLDAEQRTIFVERFAEALRRLEGEPIEGQAKQIAA